MGELLTKICVALLLCGPPAPQHPPEFRQIAPAAGQQQTGTSPPASTSDQRGTRASPMFVQVLPTSEDQRKAEEAARDRREQAKLGQDLLKATSDLADFSRGLAIATAALIAATLALAVLAWLLVRRSHMTERAYVTMGGRCEWDPQRHDAYFIAHLDNFGRTPAFIEHVFLRVYSRGELLPELPDYSHPAYQTRFAHHIDAEAKSVDARIRPQRVTGIADPAVYGRVWYTDMFRKKRSYGFIAHIEPDPLDPAVPPRLVMRPISDPRLKRYADWT